MNIIGENANGIKSKYENPSTIIRKIATINAPKNIPVTKFAFFFFLTNSSVVRSLKFSFAIIIYFDCDCRFLLATNVKVLARLGEFENVSPELMPV